MGWTDCAKPGVLCCRWAVKGLVNAGATLRMHSALFLCAHMQYVLASNRRWGKQEIKSSEAGGQQSQTAGLESRVWLSVLVAGMC